MTSKATDKIIDALTELMEGFAELQEAAEKEFKTEGVELSEEADEEASAEIDAAVVNEMRAALESVIENEDYSAEEFADVISALTDSLEEIDPGVFVEHEAGEEDDSDDIDDDLDDDDDLYDDDDDDLEEYDEDDDDDEEEEGESGAGRKKKH